MINTENSNFSSLSDEEKITYLNLLIDKELEKNDEDMDLDFVDECSKLIFEIKGEGKCCFEECELDKTFENLLKRYQIDRMKKSSKERGVKRKLGKLILVATLTFVLITAGTLIISAYENDFLRRLFPESFRGTIIKPHGTVTVVENGAEKKYSDFYDFVISEGLGTLRYPHSEKIIVDKIIVNYTDDETHVKFVPRDCNVISFDVSNKNIYSEDVSTGPNDFVTDQTHKMHFSDGSTMTLPGTYYSDGDNHVFIFEHKGWHYWLVTTDYSDGLDIIRVMLL